ncbi:uncharacterized protein [Palaemon carinicauda]|uniref:uncharacterized protein n=1 Tax=Palaemon carinicauda TaxID=392227 RepID=UPI0035B694EB
MMGLPVFARFRRTALNLLAAAKQTFTEVKETNLCPNASSPLLSPLHIILKKDGSLRLCGDDKHSNMQTEPNHCPLPNIANMTSYLHKEKVFSTLPFCVCYLCSLPPKRNTSVINASSSTAYNRKAL